MSKSLALGLTIATIAAPAMAADLGMPPLNAPPVPVAFPIAFTWTGCYIGVEGGGAWGHTDATSAGTVNGVPDGTAGAVKINSHDTSGGLVGGTLGCNYQFPITNIVVGIEGDGSWAQIQGSSVLAAPSFDTRFSENETQQSFYTARGRVGYAWDKVLIYATGGAAFSYAEVREFNTVAGTFTTCGGVPQPAGACSAAESLFLSGWTAGAGIEYAIFQRWFIKAEYLHADLGRETYFNTTATACCTAENRRFTDEIFRAGLNWRFSD